MLHPRGVIKKDNHTFKTKFIVPLVRHYISPTTTYNIVTWDKVVLGATFVAMFDVDISRLLLAIIYERDFESTATYPFPYLIFELCRSAGVPIWHITFLGLLLGQLI